MPTQRTRINIVRDNSYFARERLAKANRRHAIRAYALAGILYASLPFALSALLFALGFLAA